jgi:hypothetical protein
VVKFLGLQFLLFFLHRYSPHPHPLLVRVNQCKEFVTADIPVERKGIVLTEAYRETPEKGVEQVEGYTMRADP